MVCGPVWSALKLFSLKAFTIDLSVIYAKIIIQVTINKGSVGKMQNYTTVEYITLFQATSNLCRDM